MTSQKLNGTIILQGHEGAVVQVFMGTGYQHLHGTESGYESMFTVGISLNANGIRIRSTPGLRKLTGLRDYPASCDIPRELYNCKNYPKQNLMVSLVVRGVLGFRCES